MLDDSTIIQEAHLLHEAEQYRKQIEATTVRHPDMDIADAYRIQEAWIRHKLNLGRRIIGHKIGLTSRTMQRAMRIDEPDFGVLLDDMVFENDRSIRVRDFLDLRVEVELAFVLKEPLPPGTIGIDEVLNRTERVVPAIELIAARTYRVHPETGYVRTVLDTISDNAANAGIVLGDTDLLTASDDLKWVGAILSKNNTVEETGLAAGVLGHPALGIAWLSQKYHMVGRSLSPGQIILAGSFTKPVVVQAGDHIVADFGRFGTLSCNFI